MVPGFGGNVRIDLFRNAPLTLTDGEYTWWIRTYNSVGYGPWSSGMKFTVDTASMPGTVTLISPGEQFPILPPHTYGMPIICLHGTRSG